jgi:hypothetical protein
MIVTGPSFRGSKWYQTNTPDFRAAIVGRRRPAVYFVAVRCRAWIRCGAGRGDPRFNVRTFEEFNQHLAEIQASFDKRSLNLP